MIIKLFVFCLHKKMEEKRGKEESDKVNWKAQTAIKMNEIVKNMWIPLIRLCNHLSISVSMINFFFHSPCLYFKACTPPPGILSIYPLYFVRYNPRFPVIHSSVTNHTFLLFFSIQLALTFNSLRCMRRSQNDVTMQAAKVQLLLGYHSAYTANFCAISFLTAHLIGLNRWWVGGAEDNTKWDNTQITPFSEYRFGGMLGAC